MRYMIFIAQRILYEGLTESLQLLLLAIVSESCAFVSSAFLDILLLTLHGLAKSATTQNGIRGGGRRTGHWKIRSC
jgi:hypothetical protein